MGSANTAVAFVYELEDVVLVLALNFCDLLIPWIRGLFFVVLILILVCMRLGTWTEIHFLRVWLAWDERGRSEIIRTVFVKRE